MVISRYFVKAYASLKPRLKVMHFKGMVGRLIAILEGEKVLTGSQGPSRNQ